MSFILRRDSDQHWSILRQFALVAIVVMAAGALVSCGDDPANLEEGAAVEGTIIDANSQAPIEGVMVEISAEESAKAPISTSTDSQGRFEFTDLDAGRYRVFVDGTGVLANPSDATRHYGSVGIDVDVSSNQRLVVDQPFFLSVLDDDDAADVQNGQPATVQIPGVSDFSLEIAANSITFPDGSTEGEIWAVEVPVDRLPGDLPAGSWPSIAVAIYPIGTEFDPPATLSFPNRDGVADGTGMDLYLFDQATGAFVANGRGIAGASRINGDTGSEIDRASWHMPVCDAFSVSGRVLDSQEVAFAGVEVQVMADALDGSRRDIAGASAVTDANGQFTIPGVRACNFRVRASQADASGSGMTETGRMNRDDSSVDVGDVVLFTDSNRVLFNVNGTIHNFDGSPAGGVFVTWSGGFDFQDKGRDIFAETRFDGTFELRNIVGDPGARGWVSAYDEFNGRNAQFEVNVPGVAETGTTLRTDFNICTEIENLRTCGSNGSWSLSQSTLDIQFVRVDCGLATTEDISASVSDFGDGQMTVTGPFEDGETVAVNFQRVSNTGPAGISSENIQGLYRHVVGPSGDDLFFMGLFSDGTLINIEPNNQGDYAEAGTYVDTGSSLAVSPLWGIEGPGDPVNLDYTRSGDTLVIDPQGDSETFTRCWGSGSSLNGVWRSEFPESGGANVVMFRDGEYISMDVRPEER